MFETPDRLFCRLPNLWLAAILAGLFPGAGLHAEPPRTFAVQADFSKQIDRPLIAHRDPAPLAEVLERLSEDARVAILLDRRIDPESRVDVRLNAPHFDDGIRQLVQPAGAAVSIVGDTLVVAPQETALNLRTRIALAEQQQADLIQGNARLRLEFARRSPIRWESLAAPRDILAGIADRFGIIVQNPEAIEHDLWRSGELANVTCTEALMAIACQFGLQVSWINATTCRLVPEQPDPRVVQRHSVRGQNAAERVQEIRSLFPDSQLEQTGNVLTARARIEDQLAIAQRLGLRSGRKAPPNQTSGSLATRRFTLRMVRRPFQSLVDVLREQGIEVEYDQKAMDTAGVDLQQKLSLELNQATIEELLETACTPLNLDFQIDGTRVLLAPAGD